MNIYVGNLSRDVTEEDLRQAFEVHGQVSSIAIIKHRSTGIPRGFGFVEMPTQAEPQAAIDSLNGTELEGKVHSRSTRLALAPRVAEDVVARSVSSKCRGARNVKNAESRLRRRKDW